MREVGSPLGKPQQTGGGVWAAWEGGGCSRPEGLHWGSVCDSSDPAIPVKNASRPASASVTPRTSYPSLHKLRPTFPSQCPTPTDRDLVILVILRTIVPQVKAQTPEQPPTRTRTDAHPIAWASPSPQCSMGGRAPSLRSGPFADCHRRASAKCAGAGQGRNSATKAPSLSRSALKPSLSMSLPPSSLPFCIRPAACRDQGHEDILLHETASQGLRLIANTTAPFLPLLILALPAPLTAGGSPV